jgi:hypothetical protein
MLRISISVSRIAAMLLKTIQVRCEKSDLAEFALSPEPIIKLAAWQTPALEIDFVSAAPDLVVIRLAVRSSIFCARLNGSCVKLQGLTSPALRCHTQALSFGS